MPIVKVPLRNTGDQRATPKHNLDGAENTFDVILLNVIKLDNMTILENEVCDLLRAVVLVCTIFCMRTPSVLQMNAEALKQRGTGASEISETLNTEGKISGLFSCLFCFSCIVWMAELLGPRASQRQLILSSEWTGLSACSRIKEKLTAD